MLLAVDTSTTWIGLALFDGVRVLGEMVFQSKNHHTVELSPSVHEILDRCGVKPAELPPVLGHLPACASGWHWSKACLWR
jgi:tRNA threonylcarbamoyladenosine biosynthesis protein TsaB